MSKNYSVIYRTGGTVNFKWNRVLETYKTMEAARAIVAELEKMGYKALVHHTRSLNLIGLPETFE